MFKQPDPDITRNWWLSCIADEAKLARWLQKLQRTEYSGYTEHADFMAANDLTARQIKILTNIAEDELEHSGLLINVMGSRGISKEPEGAPSTYWDDMLAEATTMDSYCAANYFGEALAADRFNIIIGMEETPNDIRRVISQLLPDEIFHRETLFRIAGPDALATASTNHDIAFRRLISARTQKL